MIKQDEIFEDGNKWLWAHIFDMKKKVKSKRKEVNRL